MYSNGLDRGSSGLLKSSDLSEIKDLEVSRCLNFGEGLFSVGDRLKFYSRSNTLAFLLSSIGYEFDTKLCWVSRCMYSSSPRLLRSKPGCCLSYTVWRSSPTYEPSLALSKSILSASLIRINSYSLNTNLFLLFAVGPEGSWP